MIPLIQFDGKTNTPEEWETRTEWEYWEGVERIKPKRWKVTLRECAVVVVGGGGGGDGEDKRKSGRKKSG